MALYLYGSKANINFVDNLSLYLQEDLERFFKEFIVKKKTSSKYKNVSFDKKAKRWRAYVCLPKRKQLVLGWFDTQEKAHKARRNYDK